MEDRRKFERSKIPPFAASINQIEGKDKVYKQVTIIIDEVSEEGLRFKAPIPFEIGEDIRFLLPTLYMDSYVQGRISWVRKLAEGDYQYGLHIINE